MKKNILICVGVLLIMISSTWLFLRPKSLGNIRNNFSEPTTKTSTITFSGKEGDKIRILFRSNIKSGDLEINIYDSEGDKVYDLGKAGVLKTFYTLNKSDTYTLAAEHRDFIGNYSVKAYLAD